LGGSGVKGAGFGQGAIPCDLIGAICDLSERQEVAGNVLEKRGWDWVKGVCGGVVGCHKPVDFFRGARGEAGKADRGGCRGRGHGVQVQIWSGVPGKEPDMTTLER